MTIDSVFRIPIHVAHAAVVQLVEARLPETLVDDPDLGGYGVQVAVSRCGPVQLDFDEVTDRQSQIETAAGQDPRIVVELAVPLSVRLRKFHWGTCLEATGRMSVRTRTTCSIRADWNLKTSTSLQGIEWTEAPRLRLGAFQIPIRKLTQLVVDRVHPTLTRSIDSQIATRGSLRPALQALYERLTTPIPIEGSFGAYVTVRPRALGLGAVFCEESGIVTAVELGCDPVVSLAPAPSPEPLRTLPDNTGVTHEISQSTLLVHGTFAPADLERVLAQALQNHTFELLGRRITVRDVAVRQQGARLLVSLRTEGAYVGQIEVAARPSYGERSATVQLLELTVRLATRNLLYRALGAVLGRRLRELIEEQFERRVGAAIETARLMIADRLDGMEPMPGFRINGTVDRLGLREVSMGPDGLHVVAEWTGEVGLTVLHP